MSILKYTLPLVVEAGEASHYDCERPLHVNTHATKNSSGRIVTLTHAPQRIIWRWGTWPLPNSIALGGLPTSVPMPPMLAGKATPSSTYSQVRRYFSAGSG